jgi:endonuclease/exonuclease/phosphatase family metal-dependent hydrolase
VRLPLLVAISLLASLPGTARAAQRDTLTVVTLNLWHDQHDWPRRLGRILEGMRAIRPDVLCLQEVLQHATLPNQARTIADSLGYHWYFTSVDSVTRTKRYGNAILTPHRVLLSEGRNLAPLDDYRVAAHVRLAFRGREIDVYDTHLHHTIEGGAIRATQIRDLLGYISATRGQGPLVLAGDFNAGADTPEMAPLASGFLDTWALTNPGVTGSEAATMNPLFDAAPRQIDHIFVARTGVPVLTPLSTEVLFRGCGPDSVWASDHYGVAARITIGAGAKGSGRR